MSYLWGPELEFEYTPTQHNCPACGQVLLRVDASSMLVCNKAGSEEHGPYFLV